MNELQELNPTTFANVSIYDMPEIQFDISDDSTTNDLQ
jgi:hypothetical protein